MLPEHVVLEVEEILEEIKVYGEAEAAYVLVLDLISVTEGVTLGDLLCVLQGGERPENLVFFFSSSALSKPIQLWIDPEGKFHVRSVDLSDSKLELVVNDPKLGGLEIMRTFDPSGSTVEVPISIGRGKAPVARWVIIKGYEKERNLLLRAVRSCIDPAILQTHGLLEAHEFPEKAEPAVLPGL